MALFVWIFDIFFPAYWFHILVILTAFTLFPNRRPLILLLANVYFMLASDLVFNHLRKNAIGTPMWEIVPELIKSRGMQFSLNVIDTFGFKVLLIIALLGFFYLYLLAAKRLRVVGQHPALILFIVVMLFLLLTTNMQNFPLICVFSWGLLNSITRSFLYIAYSAADQKFIRQKSLLLQGGSFIPFWNGGNWGGMSVVPRGYRGIENTAAQSPEELAALQLNALKLIFWSLVLRLLSDLLRFILFQQESQFFEAGMLPTFSFIHYENSGLEQYVLLDIPWYERWATLLGTTLIFFISFAAAAGCVISLVRMAGFRVFRQVYRPFEARSFNDFLGRIYFYYIDVVTKFFFFPFWKYSRFLSDKKGLRIFITSFLSIFIAGIVLHFLREFPDIVKEGVWGAVRLAMWRSPYFITLGLCVGISSVLTRQSHTLSPSFLRGLANSMLFFIVYSFCWSLQIGFRSDSFEDRLNFILALFGMRL